MQIICNILLININYFQSSRIMNKASEINSKISFIPYYPLTRRPSRSMSMVKWNHERSSDTQRSRPSWTSNHFYILYNPYSKSISDSSSFCWLLSTRRRNGKQITFLAKHLSSDWKLRRTLAHQLHSLPSSSWTWACGPSFPQSLNQSAAG